MIKIAPSILTSDFAGIGESLAKIEKSGGDMVHLDVMDGHFVPPLTFGPKMVADIRKKTELEIDVHLMISNPDLRFQDYLDAGADCVTFHVEACMHVHRLIEVIHSGGCKAGISLVPSTPVHFLDEILGKIDRILVMTVDPGYGGQTVIPSCLDKVRLLAEKRENEGFHYELEVDGGVSEETVTDFIECGADILVTGSAFFNSSNPRQYISRLKALS